MLLLLLLSLLALLLALLLLHCIVLQVMWPILWELLNSVFIGFPTIEEKLKGDNPLQALYGLNTYFDKHREQIEIYDDVSFFY